VGGYGGVRPWRAALFGASADLQLPRIGAGTTEGIPPTDAVFDESTAPGLEGEHDYLRVGGFVDIDYRQPRYPRKGGRYRFDASHYQDRTGTFDFWRFDGDLQQFFSGLAERRVLALRLYASTSETTDGGQMPFYYMPTLGGHNTLRGHRDYRFRGAHAVLANAEYRWEIWSGLDAALFYDTGKVTDTRADLNFRDLNNVYGFGFRFNTDNGVIVRIDAGFGSQDGQHLYIVFGDVF
jgi:hemolysin activation/secretion protein